MSEANATNSDASDSRPVYRLMFFVAGDEPNSLTARENLQKICREETDCQFEVQEVNVLEDYQIALAHRVLVTPCLILLEPSPQVMIAGTLKDMEKVHAALRLRPE